MPFSNGISSVGVVAEPAVFGQEICHYRLSGTVKACYGKGYALLGNAGEFLAPVFSSGVTVAMNPACWLRMFCSLF